MTSVKRLGAKITGTAAWTYGWLSLSMIALGIAAQRVFATIFSTGWDLSQGFPTSYWIFAFTSLGFVGLAKLGGREHAPSVSRGALLGLIAVVAGVLSFNIDSLVFDPPFWAAVVGGIITFISLFVGWRGDASEKKLKAEIKELEAKIQVKDEVIEALEGKFPSARQVVAVAGIALSLAFLGLVVGRSDKVDGGRQ